MNPWRSAPETKSGMYFSVPVLLSGRTEVAMPALGERLPSQQKNYKDARAEKEKE